MAPTIDWSLAPDDATHYSPETCDWLPCWVKQEGTAWFVRPTNRTGDPWIEDSDFAGSAPFLIPHPKPTPVWNGEGLPPVGTVCEVLNNTLNHPEWERCTILFMGKFKAVYESESCHERVADVSDRWMISFRPLRTPEQIAAEEREKAIQDLIRVTCISHGEAARIHDAGYRKVTEADHG